MSEDLKAQAIKEYTEQRDIKAREWFVYVLYLCGFTSAMVGILLLPIGDIPTRAFWAGVFLLLVAIVIGMSVLQSMIEQVLKNQKAQAQ